MPILYSVISRGTTPLAKFADCVGNFGEVTEHIIERIDLRNSKTTYTHGDYLIHYTCENKLVYMCITDNVGERTGDPLACRVAESIICFFLGV